MINTLRKRVTLSPITYQQSMDNNSVRDNNRQGNNHANNAFLHSSGLLSLQIPTLSPNTYQQNKDNNENNHANNAFLHFPGLLQREDLFNYPVPVYKVRRKGKDSWLTKPMIFHGYCRCHLLVHISERDCHAQVGRNVQRRLLEPA
jgi:hypothetical protein